MVTGPGGQLAAGRGHLRVSHADREQAIDTLKAAFVCGILAKDEFDLRVNQAFAARSYRSGVVAAGAAAPGVSRPQAVVLLPVPW
jgi:hypothetical protein